MEVKEDFLLSKHYTMLRSSTYRMMKTCLLLSNLVKYDIYIYVYNSSVTITDNRWIYNI